MMTWFQEVFSSIDNQQQHSAVLIGADCPLIDDGVIDSAFAKLQDNDVVLGPAADGGYYLIGLRGPWQSAYENLFVSMPWSSDRLLIETMQRCEAASLNVATLETREDIDTIESLDRLRAELQAAETSDAGCRDLLRQIDAILHEDAEV